MTRAEISPARKDDKWLQLLVDSPGPSLSRLSRLPAEVHGRSWLPEARRAALVHPLPGCSDAASRRLGRRLSAPHRVCWRPDEGSRLPKGREGRGRAGQGTAVLWAKSPVSPCPSGRVPAQHQVVPTSCWLMTGGAVFSALRGYSLLHGG